MIRRVLVPHSSFVVRISALRYLRGADRSGFSFGKVRAVVALLGCLIAAETRAQTTVYWDTNGNTAGSSGGTTAAGTWDQNTTSNWSTNSNGGTTGTWQTRTGGGAGNGIAVFSAGTNATGSYAVTVGTVTGVKGITFGEGTVTLTAGSLTLAATSTINTNANSATIASVIAGGFGINKTGSGTLTLSGANTFSGGTQISAGTVQVNSNTGLGTGTLTLGAGTTVQAGAGSRTLANAVVASGNFTIGGANDLTFSNTFNLGAGNRVITVANSGVTTLSGVVSNSFYATTTKAGTGTLVLSGTNTFTGPMVVNAGVLRLQNSSALGGSGFGNVVASGAELQLQGGISVSPGDFALQGSGVGAAGVVHNISGANTLGGQLTFATSSTIGLDAGSLTFSGPVTLTAGTLTTTGAGDFAILGAMNGNGGFNFGSSGSTTLSGVINASGGMTLDGSGTVTLNGSSANSGSGAVVVNNGTLVLAKTGGNAAMAAHVTVNSGTLRLGASNQIVDGKSVTLAGSGATFDLNGFNEAILDLAMTGSAVTTGAGTLSFSSGGGDITTYASASTATISGKLALGPNGSTFAVADGAAASDLTVSAVVSGTTALIKTGAGLLTLSGTNTFTGPVTLADGTISVATIGNGSVAGNLGQATNAPANLIFDGGVLQYTGATSSTNRSFTINTGKIATFDVTSNNLTISGSTTATTGGLTKTGAGTLTLSGTNQHTGVTTIVGGTLSVANIGNGGVAGNLGKATSAAGNLVFDGGALQYTGAAASTNRSFTINSGKTATIDVTTDDLTLSGASTATNGSLTKTGAGTLILSGNNLYTGATTVSQGTLVIGAAGSAGAGPLGTNATGTTVSAGATLDLNGFTLANAEALSLSGAGVGAAGALVNSSGTAVSYSGAVTLAGDATIGTTGNLTFTAGFSDNSVARTLTKTGAGTLQLSAVPTTWTTNNSVVVDNGTFEVGVTNSLGSTARSNVVVNATTPGTTATFATSAGVNQSILSLTFGGTGATSTSTNDVSIGSSSTLTLGGNVTYNATNNPLGSTISGAGSLSLGNATRTFTIGDSSAATNDLTISSTMVGAGGGIIKAGAGTLSLTGTNTFTGSATVSAGTLRGTGTTDVGGFTAFGNHSGLAVNTNVITVASGATLEVQSSYTGDVGNGITNSFKNLVLNGTGVNGGGALRSTGGNSTWTGNTVLGSNATITNAGGTGDANELFIGAYIANTDSNVALNGNTLTINGDGNTFITSKVGATAGDSGSVIINGATSNTTVTYFGYANYYTGTTTVNSGRLVSSITPASGQNAGVRGDLIIGSNSLTTTATFTETFLEQIADTAQVTINSDGTLDLATTTVADTIGSLVMKGGTVTTGAGELNIANGAGIVDVLTSNTSTIAGKFHFLAATGTINVDTGSTLLMSAKLYGTNIVKADDGKMIVTSDNITNGGYLGTTSITGGTLNIQHSNALGATSAGTTVSNGATLQLENTSGDVQVGTETLTINGAGYASQGALNSKAGADNRYGGAITMGSSSTINTDAGNLTISGSITGTAATSFTQTLTVGGNGNTAITGAILNGSGGGSVALTKADSGTVTLSGANNFTGAIAVNAGTLSVTANNSLGAQTNAVNVASGATFALSGGTVGTPYTNTIRTLTGSGLVSIAGSTTLKVNTPSADTFDGRLTGTGLFEKAGAGTFTFSSTANTSAFNFAGTVQLTAAQYVTATDTFTDGIGGKLEFKGGSSGNALTIGTLNLTGGTLLLTNAYINIGTLNITGNTVLDFGDPTTSTSSILNANNIYIAAGAVLTIKNWNSEVDFLFANSDFRQTNGGGTLAVHNAIGSAPENQVWFKGDPQSPDGSHTTWIDNATNYYSYADNQIRPVPEPATYGALLLGGCLALVGWKRLRRSSARAA